MAIKNLDAAMSASEEDLGTLSEEEIRALFESEPDAGLADLDDSLLDDEEELAEEAIDAGELKETPSEEKETPSEELEIPVAEEHEVDSRPAIPLRHADVESLTAALTKAQEERKQLRVKYNAGEIDLTQEEYEEKLDDLAERASEIREERARAQTASELNERHTRERWLDQANRFMRASGKRDGVDYQEGNQYYLQFDAAIRFIAAEDLLEAELAAQRGETVEAKGADWYLQEAHKMVLARNGIVPGKSRSGEGAARDPKVAVLDERRRKSGLEKALNTPSLSAVPAAQVADDDQGPMGSLLRLEGEAFEDALAHMSSSDLDRLARGA